MTEIVRIYAGYCTARFTTAHGRPGDDERVYRGRVVVLIKPDDTVLVHDTDGYQPVAWLTRAAETRVDDGGEGVELVAVDGDERLTVAFDPEPTTAGHVTTVAGTPVGDCVCDGQLVSSGGEVSCLRCGDGYAVPQGGRVTDETCPECGLPELVVRRGERFRVCLDRTCRPLSDAVHEALDRRLDCPDCGATLRVEDHRGRQFLGCDDYPECETAFSIPAGVVVGDCVCGLPVFERDNGTRCLDAGCPHDELADEENGDDREQDGEESTDDHRDGETPTDGDTVGDEG